MTTDAKTPMPRCPFCGSKLVDDGDSVAPRTHCEGSREVCPLARVGVGLPTNLIRLSPAPPADRPEFWNDGDLLNALALGGQERYSRVADAMISLQRCILSLESRLGAYKESLEWALQYGQWEEALDGNPLMKMAYDKAQSLKEKSPL